MTTAREIMHAGAECIGEHETLAQAARRMRDLDVGALPVCGDDDRLHGIITDRDIVIRCVAAGGDPATVTAGDLAEGTPFTIGADASAGQVLQVMEEHRHDQRSGPGAAPARAVHRRVRRGGLRQQLAADQATAEVTGGCAA